MDSAASDDDDRVLGVSRSAGTYLLTLGHYANELINTGAMRADAKEAPSMSTNSSRLMASVNGLVILADNHLHRIANYSGNRAEALERGWASKKVKSSTLSN